MNHCNLFPYRSLLLDNVVLEGGDCVLFQEPSLCPVSSYDLDLVYCLLQASVSASKAFLSLLTVVRIDEISHVHLVLVGRLPIDVF